MTVGLLSLSIVPVLPFNSSVVYAGDSITAQGSTSPRTNSVGFSTWAQIFSVSRLRYGAGSNAGIGGDTSTGLLTRYTTDVTSKAPTVVIIMIGTNDITGSTGTLATANLCIANITAMISANRGIGARTILIKVLPRGSVGSPMTANMIANWNALNAWIVTQAGSDLKVVDCEALVGNNDAAHTIQTSCYSDLLHPTTPGAKLIGQAVASVINGFVASGDALFTSGADPLNLLPNGFVTGNSSGLATGWTTNNVLGGATFAASKASRSDGFGEWQQFDASGTYTGNNKLMQLRQTVDLTGLLNSGDTCELIGEFQTSAMTGICSVMIEAIVGGTSIQADFPDQASFDSGGWSGPIRSLPITLGSNAGSTAFNVSIYFTNTAGADPIAATIKIGRLGIRKL